MTIKRNTNASRLDAAVSLLAGGSAAFVLFAMPDDVLARPFAATGLAASSPRFQPPFGADIRFGLVALAAALALAFTWSLMKALDRPPANRPAEPAEPLALDMVDEEPEAPRLRKADAHPDAPARRPLLAGRDLGEPLELTLEHAVAAEAVVEEEVAPASEAPPIADEPAPEPAPLPAFLVPQEPEEEEPSAEAPTVQPELEASSDDSISSLMRRFETGLTRKKQALPERLVPEAVAQPKLAAPQPAPLAQPQPAALAAEPKPEPVVGPAPVGHRLRSAIADLQKVAGR